MDGTPRRWHAAAAALARRSALPHLKESKNKVDICEGLSFYSFGAARPWPSAEPRGSGAPAGCTPV
jgi:hypothetical protein